MKNLSLLYPEGKGPDYEILADNTCSDLSIDCILDAVAENDIEKKIIKDIMIKLESDAEVIRYRGDIFEDIVRFPVLREKMKDMLEGKKLDIVRNNFEFSREHGIYIMTGPNRGGKTTFTQAVGMLFLMAQHGLYVPAEQMSFEPCDNILTHFPADEEKTVNMGRLGEESKRLSEIFTSASDKSLLLFNESLASTSFTEGLYIARDVVQALRFLGARTIFNTHMHELAMHPEIMNSNEGDIKVASLVTGMYEGKRSYKVFIAPPDGVSYARDIAEKYGVTLSQLKNSIISSGKTYYRCAEKNCG